jgi:metal-responsive CopG/Arc/MetJ family transcriptional regulator
VDEVRVISAKIPDEVFKEMALRIPEGDRSDFIREAIVEKLQKTPKANTKNLDRFRDSNLWA